MGVGVYGGKDLWKIYFSLGSGWRESKRDNRRSATTAQFSA